METYFTPKALASSSLAPRIKPSVRSNPFWNSTQFPLMGFDSLATTSADPNIWVSANFSSTAEGVNPGACRLSRWKGKPSRKGTGFEQPPQPHQHWHIGCFLH